MKKINRFLQGTLAALTALIMVGCHYNENPARTSLNIDTSVLVLDLGQSVTRKASSKASGAVFTYQSSNPYVASVDANGTVCAVSEGECVITVSMPEDKDDWYAAASAQFRVIVDDFISAVPAVAKGPHSTNIYPTLPPELMDDTSASTDAKDPDPRPTPQPTPSTETSISGYTPYIPVPKLPDLVGNPYDLQIDYDHVAIGQVICLDDGNIARNYDADKVPSGSVKVAMIAYLKTISDYCANGFAIALNHKNEQDWETARMAWATLTVPIFTNAGWTLPSTEAIYRMCIATGGMKSMQLPETMTSDQYGLGDAKLIELLKAAGIDDTTGEIWTITNAGSDREKWVYLMGGKYNALHKRLCTRKIRSLGVLRF